jgi:Family of unknown function (DUF6152)
MCSGYFSLQIESKESSVRIDRLTFSVFIAAILFSAGPAFAHHGASMYNMDRLITVKATVTEFDWANPHVMIYAAAHDHGSVQNWSVELRGSPSVVSRAGWNKDTIKRGEQLTFVGHPAKNGSDSMRLQKIVLANGTELNPDPPHRWF